jgi:hypothetical protein
VKADWRQLPDLLRTEVKGLRFDWQQTYPLAPGLVTMILGWKRRERQITAEVFVSGTGPGPARERLLKIATDTTKMECDMDLGPADLGDLSIQDVSPPFEELIWVFRNVCVMINNDGTGPEILPMARRIQTFMEAHVVKDLARHVPSVIGIEISPTPVRLGDTVSVRAKLAPDAAPAAELLTEYRLAGADLLSPIARKGLEATFMAREAGHTAFEILVVDRKTLLSPKAGVVIDVLPAR